MSNYPETVSVEDIGEVAEWLRQDPSESDEGWIERLRLYFARKVSGA